MEPPSFNPKKYVHHKARYMLGRGRGGKRRTSAVHVLLDEVLQLRLARGSAHLLDDHDLCVHLEAYSQLLGECSRKLGSRVHSIAQIVGRQHGTQRRRASYTTGQVSTGTKGTVCKTVGIQFVMGHRA